MHAEVSDVRTETFEFVFDINIVSSAKFAKEIAKKINSYVSFRVAKTPSNPLLARLILR